MTQVCNALLLITLILPMAAGNSDDAQDCEALYNADHSAFCDLMAQNDLCTTTGKVAVEEGVCAPGGSVDSEFLIVSLACTDQCVADCVGQWSGFGPCSKPCGDGSQTNTYEVTTWAMNGGKPCETYHGAFETRTCNEGECQEAPPTTSTTTLVDTTTTTHVDTTTTTHVDTTTTTHVDTTTTKNPIKTVKITFEWRYSNSDCNEKADNFEISHNEANFGECYKDTMYHTSWMYTCEDGAIRETIYSDMNCEIVDVDDGPYVYENGECYHSYSDKYHSVKWAEGICDEFKQYCPTGKKFRPEFLYVYQGVEHQCEEAIDLFSCGQNECDQTTQEFLGTTDCCYDDLPEGPDEVETQLSGDSSDLSGDPSGSAGSGDPSGSAGCDSKTLTAATKWNTFTMYAADQDNPPSADDIVALLKEMMKN